MATGDMSAELKLFEQHWVQLRHIEEQRATITNVFVVVVGGILAFARNTSETKDPHLFYVLLAFLLVFALFGFFFCIKVSSLHQMHKRLADLYLLQVEFQVRKLPHEFLPKSVTDNRIDNWISTSRIFTLFFGVIFSIIASMLFYSLHPGETRPHYWLLASIAVGLVIISTLVFVAEAIRHRKTKHLNKALAKYVPRAGGAEGSHGQ